MPQPSQLLTLSSLHHAPSCSDWLFIMQSHIPWIATAWSKTRSFLTRHPYVRESISWTAFSFTLTVPIGAIIPTLILRSEHSYIKYCGSSCPPYPPNTHTFIIKNLRAHVLGSALLLFPNAFAPYIASECVHGNPWGPFVIYISLGVFLATSLPIGIVILNSLSLDSTRVDPKRILIMTVPGTICELLVMFLCVLIVGFSLKTIDWMGERSLRICGSGIEVA
ncbi:hypothetical protein DL96DRAFT_1188398 [Flagelloscypha sp. PMI_526]|nr:hypothetical protein DL96DRAFT_1188398 [Flagelloscypha sp. PMI_526]